MPEGPSIVILRETIKSFNRKKIRKVSGNTTIDKKRLQNKTIRNIRSWGKHLLIEFDGFFVRIHLLMFGTYLVNEKKATPLKLGLQFAKGVVNFYTCDVKLVEGKPDDVYDFSADVMNAAWDSKRAIKKITGLKEACISDVLLDQTIFSGVGNIIKNEILFITRIHPNSIAGNIPAARKKALIKQATDYSFDFLYWKNAGTLKKHWLAYTKKTCPRCHIPLIKEPTGKGKRRSFFCNNCQVIY